MRNANILDPIQSELDQRVFRGETPRPSVVRFITKLYYKELKKEFKVDDPENYVKLFITGSLTTYQYSDQSDCDVSVFPDYAKFGGDPKDVRKRLIALSVDHIDGTNLPGTPHPLQFFVVAEGIHPEDLYKPGLRSAYSLEGHDWIVPPEKDRSHDIATDFPEVFQRAEAMADKMKTLLDAHDYDTARELWKQIHIKRQNEQRAGLGDFSEGNITYKWLLHEGLFDRIRNELHEYIAKTATDDVGQLISDADSLVDTIVQLLQSNGGNVQAAWNFLAEGNQRFTPEQLKTLFDRAERKYQQLEEENALRKQWLDEQQKNLFGQKAELYRWGLNRETGELRIVDNADDVHYEMLKKWVPDSLWDDWQGLQQWVMRNAAFGYAEYNPSTGRAEIGDDSIDLPGTDLSPEEEQQILAEVEARGRKEFGTPKQNVSSTQILVIYDFEADRIILGTSAGNYPHSKVIGTYDGKHVTIHNSERYWLNANYFRRLWAFSFPKRPLDGVKFQTGQDEDGAQTLPTRKPKYIPVREKTREVKSRWKLAQVAYDAAFVYLGAPVNRLLLEPGTSEHYDLLTNYIEQNTRGPYDFQNDPMEELQKLPMVFGHVGWYHPEPFDYEAETEPEGYPVYTIYSDFLANREADPQLIPHTIEALKQKYPNLREYNPEYHRDRNWYTGD